MKIRNGFVSNSSSSSFIICNTSDKTLTIVDFVKENPQLIEQFKKEYDSYENNPDFTQEKLIESAQNRLDKEPIHPSQPIYIIPAHTNCCLIFGDEEGDLIGDVFDYILRDGGKSKNFTWRFEESLR
jgi:hypothetical protein